MNAIIIFIPHIFANKINIRQLTLFFIILIIFQTVNMATQLIFSSYIILLVVCVGFAKEYEEVSNNNS